MAVDSGPWTERLIEGTSSLVVCIAEAEAVGWVAWVACDFLRLEDGTLEDCLSDLWVAVVAVWAFVDLVETSLRGFEEVF